MKRVLVTGASGFIGQHLCRSLQQQEMEVRAVLRRTVDGPWHQAVLCDLAEQTLPETALEGVDTVFHLAGKAHAIREPGEDSDVYHRINVAATQRLLDAAMAAGVKRLVYFSSVKAMGDVTTTVQDENSPCAPTSPYGQSKLAAEHLLFSHSQAIDVVILRPCMVYGETQKGNLPLMIRLIRRHLVPPLPDYANHRCMVHVDDMVKAALLAAEHPAAAGQVYIVNDGNSYSTRQIYDAICRGLGRQPPAWSLPKALLALAAKTGDGLAALLGRRMRFDSQALQRLSCSAQYSAAKIRRELGFCPRYDLYRFLHSLLR